MTSIEVSGDLAAVLSLDRQLVYAAARALTRTAKDSQEEVIKSLRAAFTVRGTWYLPSNRFGIRIEPATVTRLESVVKTLADWLIPHETGEDKVARGRLLAIPFEGPGRPRPSHPAKVRRNLKPNALGRAGVVIDTRRGPILAQRKGGRLTAMYGLEKRVRIRRRSTVIEPTIRTVARRLGANFEEVIAEALRTAR